MQISKTARRLGLAGCSAFAMLALGVGVANAADAPAPAPLATPAISPPLAANPTPTKLNGGPLGDIYLGGVVSGYGYAQNHGTGIDSTTRGDISNAQVWVEKTDGPLQFYAQFGGYSIPVVEIPYTPADTNTKNTFGLLPQGWVTYAPTSNFNIQVGKLPTLYGAEYTYSFQNTNIQRGINWNQENAVNRGIQANYTNGPFALSVSWNDGFYSNRYSWVTAAATYKVNPENTLVISGGANLSKFTAGGSATATPVVSNNQEIIDVIWTYSKGPLMLQPYFQYNHVPDMPRLGLKAAHTIGLSLIGKYSVDEHFSWGGRVEYMSTSKGGGVTSMNFYGPGADVWTATITPTYQVGHWFARGEASYVHVSNFTSAFGANGQRAGQLRGVIETGFLF